MNQELKQRAHKEFDEKFPIAYSHNALLGAYVSKNASVDIKTTFIDSLIDRTVQMTEERIVGKILNEETLQYKYPKINKKNTHFVKEVQLVKGYNWAIDRMRVVISDLITNKSDINKDTL